MLPDWLWQRLLYTRLTPAALKRDGDPDGDPDGDRAIARKLLDGGSPSSAPADRRDRRPVEAPYSSLDEAALSDEQGGGGGLRDGLLASGHVSGLVAHYDEHERGHHHHTSV